MVAFSFFNLKVLLFLAAGIIAANAISDLLARYIHVAPEIQLLIAVLLAGFGIIKS